MKKTYCIAIAAVVVGVLVAVPDAQAQTKKVTFAVAPLNPPPGTDTSSVRAFNNNSQAAGTASIAATSGTSRACIWERIAGQWVVRDLGLTAFFSDSYAYGINDLSQVVGAAKAELHGPSQAYFYDDVTGTCDLLSGLNGMESCANAINNLGVVCGYSRIPGLVIATVWERPDGVTWTATDLASPFESLQNRNTDTWRVNNANLVIGHSHGDGTTRAHVWERVSQGVWTLADLPGESPTARAVNNVGQIAGTHLVNGTTHPCIWNRVGGNWTLTDLSSFTLDLTGSDVADINDLGHVFGQGTLMGGACPFLIKNGVVLHLNDHRPYPLSSEWYLWLAREMDNQGQLVGVMHKFVGTGFTGFLMDTKQATYSYTSTGSAVAIKDNASASKAMTLTDNVTITDLNVKVTLTHTRYADLKFELTGPNNVTRLLCNAGAVTGSGIKTLVFDDDGTAGSIVPALALSYYDGKSTLGKWTLKISDTVKNSKTGSFTSFTLDVVPGL
jgi:subtilisin-like proprotein convertase family protein